MFTEYDCTPKDALEMTCQKAGLNTGAWTEEGAEIYTFSAQVFCEKDPCGEIIEEK